MPTATPTRQLKGTISEFPLSTPNTQLGDITSGPDGAMWFTELQNGKIGRLS